MTDTNQTPVPVNPPALPEDPQARQIALLEKIVEQQAALLIATQAQTRLQSDNKMGMRVRVVDFGMPFFGMAGLFLQATLAAIPAAIIWGFFALILR